MKRFLSIISILCVCTLVFASTPNASATDIQTTYQDEPILIASTVVNEYDVLVESERASDVLCDAENNSSIESLIVSRAQLSDDILSERYGYSDEQIQILKSYDGSPIEDNPQLRGVFGNVYGYIYRMSYDDHGVTVRFSWNWDNPPMLWGNDTVTCAWVGVNSSNGPHALRFDSENSSFHVDYYDTDASGKEEFKYRLEYDIDDANVNSDVSADFKMGDDSDLEIWAKKGYMDVTLEEPVPTNDLTYSTVAFGYGHQTLVFSASLNADVDGISISITPGTGTEKMFDGSISIWRNGYWEVNGDAFP